jgi:hypothetical protein
LLQLVDLEVYQQPYVLVLLQEILPRQMVRLAHHP